jgi:hypothetical protein
LAAIALQTTFIESSPAITPAEAASVRSTAMATTATPPWYCPAVVVSAACILIGIMWDISWHSTIGRDTFWTPAHVVIYLGGTLGGLIGGWLAFKTTFFGTPEERGASVRLWGMRAPLGAWVAIWGALAMLTSAPFDNWWHNAYGLDVQIISPPHSVLAAGMYHVVVGGWLLVLSLQNRSAGEGNVQGSFLFVAGGGILLGMAAVMVTEKSFPNLQHTATYYQVSCGLYPALMVGLARAARWRWPATTMAAIYTGLMLVMIWVLPLFKATPKLAPIYNPVTHMVPPAFPHLLIVPALGIDLLFLWIGRGRGWRRDALLVLAIATCFTVLFTAVQWHFAKFLISPEADNWFFAGQRFFSFASTKGKWWTEFWNVSPGDANYDPLTIGGVSVAWVLALVATSIGLTWGNWMAKVKR